MGKGNKGDPMTYVRKEKNTSQNILTHLFM